MSNTDFLSIPNPKINLMSFDRYKWVLLVIALYWLSGCDQKKRDLLGQELLKPPILRNENAEFLPLPTSRPLKRVDDAEKSKETIQNEPAPAVTNKSFSAPPLGLPALPPLEPDDDFLDAPFSPFIIPPPVCGDGQLQPTEQCDDGDEDNGNGCNVRCLLPICGNGAQEGFEECDDNNNLDGDGCTKDCVYERCGNKRVEIANGEQCDDGNKKAGDGCSPCCKFEECGNGVVDPEEQCDDGGTTSGDGCSDCCDFETASKHKIESVKV